MWIRTHSYMAKCIYNYIKERYQLNLRLDILEYGSVKPDLHWKYNNISHYYDDGYGFWLEEVGQLLKNSKYRSIKEFSDKLGVILHFTADFFCYAHNTKELKENTWAHLVYEMRLNKAFLHFEPFQNLHLLNCDDPYSVINRYRHDYLFSNPSLENDICFIYSASLSIADLMVNEVLLPLENRSSLVLNKLQKSS